MLAPGVPRREHRDRDRRAIASPADARKHHKHKHRKRRGRKPGTPKVDSVVVGAGFAGLTAARVRLL